MDKYRAIQKIMKGDRAIMPGEFIDDEFTKKEIQGYVKTGYAVLKVVTEKKPKQSKKVTDGKQNS